MLLVASHASAAVTQVESGNRQGVRQLVPGEFGTYAGPWFFPGSSIEIHKAVPLDNVKAMVEAVHEHVF